MQTLHDRVLPRTAHQSGAKEIKAYFVVLVHAFNHIKVNALLPE